MDDPDKKLEKAYKEIACLKKENAQLKARLKMGANGHRVKKEDSINQAKLIHETITLSPDEKLILFMDLFHGREDVYPARWVAKNGKSGYSPVCANEWVSGLCDKPKIKCADCENRKLLPVTKKVVRDHLTGKHTIGVYPLLSDETCYFLAVDFDKSSWKEDALAYLQTSKEMGVSASLERSRSGNGKAVIRRERQYNAVFGSVLFHRQQPR